MLKRAHELLAQMLGEQAEFRPGQLEAIEALVVDRSRVLVVQRTGWGKSLVYFLATRLLRDQGYGPTLLISPLLSLMRDQLLMAERIGVDAAMITSENPDDWASIEARLLAGEVDLVLVSPERLANPRFVETLTRIEQAIGLIVVDEAHCVSDWGHDFRPDYRRIGRLVSRLPQGVPLLATTATANDRVVDDLTEQLGPGLVTILGPLARESLRLQTIPLADQAERLAWLAEWIPQLPGSGIVYCLTIADCKRVAGWLDSRGISVAAYYGQLEGDERRALEDRLRANEVKALVATIALGMGFDKPDLGFVVHFQRPGSVVAYYQQIGRAGRDLEEAVVVLLTGTEDDEIVEYFIESAFPPEDSLVAVLEVIARSEDGVSLSTLERELNLTRGRLRQCLKVLEIQEAIFHEKARYIRSANAWAPARERIANVTAQRIHELERMRQFTEADTCLMEFLGVELDDPEARPCGVCAVCAGEIVSSEVDPGLLNEAVKHLRRAYLPIEPRKRWPVGLDDEHRGAITEALRAVEGRTLSVYGDAGWGRLVRDAKYGEKQFGDDLVEAAAEMIGDWGPEVAPAWVTAIPSRRSDIVPDFAARLADRLGLPFRHALLKQLDNPKQKTMENSYQQCRNVLGAFAVDPDQLLAGPVLLVDDIVDSRWSLTVCAAALREAGVEAVVPLSLASSSRGGGG